jgi:hypothetical protein
VSDTAPADDDGVVVKHLLAAVGIHPSDEDLRTLTRQYGDIRRQLADLWALDVGEDEPATTYRATGADGPTERR